jgi:hypothetical protein
MTFEGVGPGYQRSSARPSKPYAAAVDNLAARRLGRGRRKRAAAFAGPLLIGACVLFALRGFVVDGSLTNQHPDLLTMWLPRWTFLGGSLAAGDLPLWNPFEMAGYRFAADPQSGWLYAAPMLLFASLPPGAALRAFVVLNPLLAGLGLYGFLRAESLPRVAATAGGLVLAMTISTSTIAISLPFAGALAWSTVLLLSAARYRRGGGWPGRLGWLALGAFAWSQVASAHLSHGLVIATVVTAAYLIAGAVADARASDLSGRAAAGRVALFLVALPLAALPILVPRIDFIGSSSLRGGYGALGDPGQTEVGDALGQEGVWAAWPLGFAAAPGAYVGAAALACGLLAARSRRLRPLVIAVGGVLVIAYALTSTLLVTAGWFRSIALRIPFGDVYLHNPARLRYVAVLGIPVLVAAGIDGLRERPLSSRSTAAWLVFALGLFVVWPALVGNHPVRYLMAGIALLLVAPLLFGLATRRWRWATGAVLVGAIAAELLAGAVYAQLYEGGTIFTGLESGDHPILVPQVLRYPRLSEEAYLRVTPIATHLRREPGRYATWAPPEAYYEKGYLWLRSAADWPALAPSRGTLFGVPDALGYNPVQLPRYWRYIRATNALSVFYNASVLNDPAVRDVRLLGLRYLVVPAGIEPTLPARIVARADRYALWELFDAQPLATVTDVVVAVDDAPGAVATVLAPGFDPARTVVVEARSPLVPAANEPAFATGTVQESSPTRVALRIDPAAGGILTVRAAFDPGWRATVDGRPARTLPVDGFLQGVVLGDRPAERVVLTYHDDAVVLGLALGAVVWAALLAAPLASGAIETARERRATRPRREPLVGAAPPR